MAERGNEQRAASNEQRGANHEPHSTIEDLRRELSEAQEREAATADVLRLISRSPAEPEAVFQAICDSAVRLTGSETAGVQLVEGSTLRTVALHGPLPLVGSVRDLRATQGVSDRVIQEGRLVHLYGGPEAIEPDFPVTAGLWRRSGTRSGVYLPLTRQGSVAGVLGVRRTNPEPYTPAQMALLQTFADQAVIAIEDARLFDEVQARNRELTQTLEQQTGVADVLGVIGASPTDLTAVFEMLSSTLLRLCDASSCVIASMIGNDFVRWQSRDRSLYRELRDPGTDNGGFLTAVMTSGQPLHVVGDISEWRDRYPRAAEQMERLGLPPDRAAYATPVLRDGVPTGGLIVLRNEARPFSEREMALIRTFADQAMIAIENARLFEELQQRNRDQAEALEREQATAEVLRVISRSPEDLDASLQAVADTAYRLCHADFARVLLRDDDFLVSTPFAHAGLPIEPSGPLEPGQRVGPIGARRLVTCVAAHTGRTVHVEDYLAHLRNEGVPDPGSALLLEAAERAHVRTFLAVPMLRAAEVVGVLTIARHGEIQPFTDREIALAETFADQAAIAVENARLFQGIQERNKELAEALEQQTATADVLKVISRSPVELQPVLQALGESAARLCEAVDASIYAVQGEVIRLVAWHNRRPVRAVPDRRLSQGYLPDRAVVERRTLHIAGTCAELESEFPETAGAIRLGGWDRAALLAVPLLREGQALGVFLLRRPDARPFTGKQIALVETFADQAVIAMENARLFDELQQRNREQAEALEREQATAEVLRVISRSPEDLDASLQAVAETAARLCNASFARVFLKEGEDLIAGPTSLAEEPDQAPAGTRRIGRFMDLAPTYLPAEAIRTGRRVQVADLQQHRLAQTPSDRERADEAVRVSGTIVGDVRTSLWVPLLHGSEIAGVLGLARLEVRPYSERELALAEMFADQAAIAVENARLFQSIQERNRELTEALEQQTATADVLKVISRSPVALPTVLEALGESAARLCEASDATILRVDGESIEAIAGFNRQAGRLMFQKRALSRGWIPDRAALERRTVHVVGAPEDFEGDFPDSAALGREHGVDQVAGLAVPLLRDLDSVGVFLLRRHEARPFTDKQVALVETFADQAVIAMENARLFDELEQRNREQAEALEREQATAEVLRIISRSPEDLDASLQVVADTAARLCKADIARVYLRDGDYLVPAPYAIPARVGNTQSAGVRSGSDGHLGPMTSEPLRPLYDAVLTARTVHAGDFLAYLREHGFSQEDQASRGLHTVLQVPLLRGGAAIGTIFLGRGGAIRPFSEREIALAETFADQAAIAVENARLFQGIQERNRELIEALEQQTATADVLRVISQAPTELQRVLDTLAANSARLLGGDVGRIYRTQSDLLVCEAVYSGNPGEPAPAIDSIPLTRGTLSGRAVLDEQVTANYGTWEERQVEFPDTVPQTRTPGVSAGIAVPLMRQGRAIGTFFVRRLGASPYTDREIALLRTFADQAVIAMDNARLFDELQQRNREQAEALEREEATAEVLRVISRSPEHLDTALQAVADTAARLCRADFARVFLQDGEYLVAGPTGPSAGSRDPHQPGERVGPITERSGAVLRAAALARTIHVADTSRYGEEFGLTEEELTTYRESVRLSGGGTALDVPLLRGSNVVGVLMLVRRDKVQPFSAQEIALAETFADQAAIAVENARLFQDIQDRNRELTEALEQQTATSDVLRIISRSPVELQTVLDTLVENAVRLCNGDAGMMWRAGGDRLRLESFFSVDGAPRSETLGDVPVDRGSIVGAAALERTVVSYYGTAEDRLREFPRSPTADLGGVKGRVAVPLVREGEAVGVFMLIRREDRAFSEREIALVRTFADQAVIAMENARLFAELEGRTRELEAASRAKSEFLSRMSHELRTPLNAIIGFGEIMEMDPATTTRQHDRVHHILQGGRHLLGLINEVLDITRIEAGRLSLSPEPVQLDGVVQEVLDLERPLAAEAEVRLEIDDPDAFRVAVQADRQRLRQIVLNLVANAVKYNRRGGRVTLSASYQPSAVSRQQPEVGARFIAPAGADAPAVPSGRAGETPAPPEADTAPMPPSHAGETPALPEDAAPYPPDTRYPIPDTRADAPRVRVSVSDTGPGIAPEEIGRLFAPFERLSAEVTGVEGTGLGLAIACGLAEAMGGSIGVESVVGAGSTFWVELPRAELPVAGLLGGGVQDPARQGADAAATGPTGTVLYIEDNQPNVDLVQEALKFRPGVTLLTAPDGATGIRIARRYRPALILLDLNLPELQGDEVLARLRADDRTEAIPVVMVSADATQGQIDRLLAAGARDYLTKPLDVKRLLAIVDEIAARGGNA